MRFDDKTPAEITECLLKEGFFTRLINAAKAKSGEERLAEAAHEPLNTGEERDELTFVAKHLFVPFVSGIRPPENLKEIKSYSVKSRRHQVGDAILYLMEQAEKSIYVTHFFREQYSLMYREVQLEKIREGLVFERLVERHLEYSDDYKWLDDFHDEHGNPIGKYREYSLATNRLFNFDFMIIDETYVVLVHREHTLDEAIIVENESMAQIFLNIWQNLKPQKDCQGNYTDLTTTVTPHNRRKLN